MMRQGNSNTQLANENDSTIDNGIFDSDNSYNENTDAAHSFIKPMSFNFEYWKELDPTYIELRWGDREKQRPIMMSAALFGAMAWFWLIVPIVQSAWVLSRGGKRLVGPHLLLAAVSALVFSQKLFQYH